LLRRASSRVSFFFALILVIYMGILYITYGAVRVTERTGEWFFLFFLLGIIQYAKETWFGRKDNI
jgi:hypothetical protein